jgi:hypothetical protein
MNIEYPYVVINTFDPLPGYVGHVDSCHSTKAEAEAEAEAEHREAKLRRGNLFLPFLVVREVSLPYAGGDWVAITAIVDVVDVVDVVEA